MNATKGRLFIVRRNVVRALGAAALATSPLLFAQTQKTLRRVGFLNAGTSVSSGFGVRAFRDGLKDLGWIEGRDIVIDVRFADGVVTRMDGLIAELIVLKPDLILAGTTQVALAARRATRDIPIVFCVASDPVGDGLVASLARPGGNITGLSSSSSELVPKRMQLLKECIPALSRVAVLTDPTASYNVRALEDVRRTALQFGTGVTVLNASSEKEIDAAFDKLSRESPDGIFIMDSVLNFRHRQKIAARVAITRIPAIYPIGQFADEGGLIAYGVSFASLFNRAAAYVDKILKGAKPSDLPVEQPTKFELVVNLKTAKALGLTIPQSILVRADRVIE